jgi:hypothetical protein
LLYGVRGWIDDVLEAFKRKDRIVEASCCTGVLLFYIYLYHMTLCILYHWSEDQMVEQMHHPQGF